MRTAQRLYEGVDFGEGPVGLITYMRTDSVSLAVEAVARAPQVDRAHLRRRGRAVLAAPVPHQVEERAGGPRGDPPDRPPARTPEQLAGKLDPEPAQALHAHLAARGGEPDGGRGVRHRGRRPRRAAPGNTFRANGSTLVSPGFLAVYRESVDDATLDDEDDRRLPALEKGDRVKLLSIKPEQHFTEPPPRYSEASLVKALEEYGIGRPSTYASIIQTLLFKKYCELVSRRFVPTDLGKIVNRFLTGNFERYVDFGFTASMEDELDNISRGEEEWVPVLERFWSGLKKQIDDVEENVTRSDVAMARDIGVDPVSGRPVSVRYGKYGAFAQIGTRDDTDKPKFASLRPGQHMDDLTLEQALELFKLPRTLGTMPDGQPIRVAVGRFGPYAQYGTKSYVSLKAEDDPYTVTLERALALIHEKQQIEANRIIREFPEAGVQVLNGRYGPYITDGKKNGKIPKDRDPKSLTLEECQALIAAAPERKGRWAKKATPAKTAKAKAKTAIESDAAGSAPKKKGTARKKTAATRKTAAKSGKKQA